ncbi:hypothetical protein AC1031_017751 [Aphanomyces cochlioides]|nr:hypothetical protein AC1031_017751 [Aphanomyces cochlioides]
MSIEVHPDESSSRGKFACRDDVSLLQQVSLCRPWEAGYGKVMEHWAEIATKLKDTSSFRLKKNAPALKTRFEAIMAKFSNGEAASIRKSGTVEEYDERDQLLTDIKMRMNDFAQNEDLRKDVETRKREGIENSGMLMRTMAMAEMTSVDPDFSAKKRKKASPQKLQKDDQVKLLIDAISSGHAQKRERDESIGRLKQERLQFDKDQAIIQQHADNQRAMLAFMQALGKNKKIKSFS